MTTSYELTAEASGYVLVSQMGRANRPKNRGSGILLCASLRQGAPWGGRVTIDVLSMSEKTGHLHDHV